MPRLPQRSPSPERTPVLTRVSVTNLLSLFRSRRADNLRLGITINIYQTLTSYDIPGESPLLFRRACGYPARAEPYLHPVCIVRTGGVHMLSTRPRDHQASEGVGEAVWKERRESLFPLVS